MRAIAVTALFVILLSACSPEASRDRGEAGADPGNRAPVVDMHGRTDPSFGTPIVGSAAEAER